MTDELPERLYLDTLYENFAVCKWDRPRATAYLRADTAIPRVEADAMWAAAVEKAADELMMLALATEGNLDVQKAQQHICDSIPADARAAFERAVREAVEKDRALDERAVTEMRDDAVREAVEAERERCAAMVDAKGQQWWQRTSGDDFTATDMADLAAAIRAPQEPTE